MNLFSRILNVTKGNAAPKSITSIAGPANEGTVHEGLGPIGYSDAFKASEALMPAQPAKPVPVPKDDFEKLRQDPAYNPHQMFVPSPQFFHELGTEMGEPIILEADAKELGRLAQAEAKLHQELVTVGFDAARHKLNEIHVKNARAIEAGDTSSIEPVPDLELLNREFEVRRLHVRNQMKSIRVATDPINKRICERLIKLTKKLAIEMDAAERKAAQRWGGTKFEPSHALRTVVFLARQGFADQERLLMSPGSLLWHASSEFLK